MPAFAASTCCRRAATTRCIKLDTSSLKPCLSSYHAHYQLSARHQTCERIRRVVPPRRSKSLVVRAEKGNNGAVKAALKVSSELLETASGWVPESVPRPAAKGIVAVGGGVIAFWLVQKVLSTVFTIALLVGGAYLWINSSSQSSDSESSGEGDEEDPVARARRIMDKYK